MLFYACTLILKSRILLIPQCGPEDSPEIKKHTNRNPILGSFWGPFLGTMSQPFFLKESIENQVCGPIFGDQIWALEMGTFFGPRIRSPAKSVLEAWSSRNPLFTAYEHAMQRASAGTFADTRAWHSPSVTTLPFVLCHLPWPAMQSAV